VMHRPLLPLPATVVLFATEPDEAMQSCCFMFWFACLLSLHRSGPEGVRAAAYPVGEQAPARPAASGGRATRPPPVREAEPPTARQRGVNRMPYR